MENAGDTLDGAPPSTEAVASMGTQPSTPNRLDEADLLRYQLLSERAKRFELQHAVHQAEVQRSELELSRIAGEGLAHMRHIEQKYGVDMRLFTVTEDGTLAPRPPEARKA